MKRILLIAVLLGTMITATTYFVCPVLKKVYRKE